MTKVERIKELTELLKIASYAYYGQDNPVMSDKQYDNLYDELSLLEKDTGIILAGSPTQKVQGYLLDGFKKVEHSKPMLSANKTKDIKDIEKFVGSKIFYASYKLDGLTIVVRYKDGKFIQGITRGNGFQGEDVTEQCKFIKNLPMAIPFINDLELRGECVIDWDNFDMINKSLSEPYSHPRNLAAGSIRNLDLNIVRNRRLAFVVFECVIDIGIDSKYETLNIIESLGFDVVRRVKSSQSIEQICNEFVPEFYNIPVDGIVFEIDSKRESVLLGSTAHHECCRMAFKWADNLYETTLKDIEWSTSKSGLINPVAVFEPVDLDGAITSRATLHNVSYIEDLQLGIGDKIQVYRANMVIPKIYDNLTKSNTWKLPDRCPNCGGPVKIYAAKDSKTLHCMNPNCQAKLLSKLVHFVSKNAINIEGMSEQTLQKFIEMGWIQSFKDIYHLSDHKEKIYKLDGFAKKSVDKLLENIEKSRVTSLERFIFSLSIPLVGRSASKTIAQYCRKIALENMSNDISVFFDLIERQYNWTCLSDFGDVICESLNGIENSKLKEFYDLSKEFDMESRIMPTKQLLLNKIFVITGKLNKYENRDKLIDVIESLGGKVSGSVSSKTSYLINNDISSKSGKNKKALELSIPIISEDDFIKMLK